jgi:hypothetical protein
MQPKENETIADVRAEIEHWQEVLGAAEADAGNKTDQVQDAYLGEVHKNLEEACELLGRADAGDSHASSELHSKVANVRTLFKRMERQSSPGGPPLA